MIVRETEHDYVMIKQHDHAHLSGAIARHFSKDVIQYDAYEQDLMLAVLEHDHGWIRLDDTPIWNDRIGMPFTFIEYPLLPKLTLYAHGLNEIEYTSSLS